MRHKRRVRSFAGNYDVDQVPIRLTGITIDGLIEALEFAAKELRRERDLYDI